MAKKTFMMQLDGGSMLNFEQTYSEIVMWKDDNYRDSISLSKGDLKSLIVKFQKMLDNPVKV